MTPNVTIISGSAGAGHDGAAAELTRRLGTRGCAVTRLDFLDLLGPRFGPALRRGYARQLATAPRTWSWLLGGLRGSPRLAGAASRALYRLAGARTRAVLAPAPDLVVSVYPLASQVLGQLRERGELAAPTVTFLTDMSVHPLWVARGVDLHLALHEVAAELARAAGAPVVRVGGAAVRPRFCPGTDPVERASVRARYAIPGDRPAALIFAGSWGVGDVLASAADVAATGLVTPVTVCGNNTKLRDTLAARGLGVALGWVDDLAPLIRACDVVLQNAGGLTSLEALACGVPVLSYRCLDGHGVTNAAALERTGLVPWPRDPGALAAALAGAVRGPRPAIPDLVTADPTEHLLELAAAGRQSRVVPA